MEFVVGAASWALGKALASAKDTLAETWAASKGIGDNLDVVEMELLHAQWILDHPHVKRSSSTPLAELLVKLRQVAYEADDVLHELEYYRIQDDLEGTQRATIGDDGGGLFLHARSTANAIGKRLACGSSTDDSCTHVDMAANRRRFPPCCAWPSRTQQIQTPKLKFDRVDMSTRMKKIVDKLKPLCAKLNTILDTELLGSAKPEQLGRTTQWKGGAKLIETKLYGREEEKNRIVHEITRGEYSANQLSVLPIVGPGGIGKTTLIHHIYKEVKSHFHVSIWICVSTNFNADRLAKEIVRLLPPVYGETGMANDQELIEQRLKGKRFFIVLDDMWTSEKGEWLKLTAPFRKVGGKGNTIILKMARDVAKYIKRRGKQEWVKNSHSKQTDRHRQKETKET